MIIFMNKTTEITFLFSILDRIHNRIRSSGFEIFGFISKLYGSLTLQLNNNSFTIKTYFHVHLRGFTGGELQLQKQSFSGRPSRLHQQIQSVWGEPRGRVPAEAREGQPTRPSCADRDCKQTI